MLRDQRVKFPDGHWYDADRAIALIGSGEVQAPVIPAIRTQAVAIDMFGIRVAPGKRPEQTRGDPLDMDWILGMPREIRDRPGIVVWYPDGARLWDGGHRCVRLWLDGERFMAAHVFPPDELYRCWAKAPDRPRRPLSGPIV